MVRCRKLVLGLGSQPSLPACCDRRAAPYIHSADYLRNKAQLQQRDSITIVGSGQSAAEVFHDLLRDSAGHDYSLADHALAALFQMENTKLTLELISPDYTEYFYDLPEARRRQILAQQSSLYKGINASLINQIYDLLDEKIHDGDRRYTLLTNSELRAPLRRAQARYHLEFQHVDYAQPFSHVTDGLVLATGYAHSIPACINPIHDRIAERGRQLPDRPQLRHRPRRRRDLRAEHRPAQPWRHQPGPGLLLPPQLADPARADRRGALPGRGPHRAAGVPPARQRRAGASPDRRAAGKRLHAAATELMPMMGGHRAATV